MPHQEAITLFPELRAYIDALDPETIPGPRKEALRPLIGYGRSRLADDEPVHLHFICTHNSRRSQLAQVWAQVAAAYHGIDVTCHSGGTEVTAFHPNAIATLERAGFRIEQEGSGNPLYKVAFSPEGDPMEACSKTFDDPANPTQDFAAIMTCSHANEHCPFIPGCEVRIPLDYEDPKAHDGTPQETKKYEACSRQVANEMFHALAEMKAS